MNKDINYYAHRNTLIAQEYSKATSTSASLAAKYGITVRQLQRICKEAGVIRTIADSNRLMSKYKNYEGHKNPDKQVRRTLPRGLRYQIISAHPFCTVCGATMMKCPLHVDHIDGNNRNNDIKNLQVLCLDCNFGKAQIEKSNRCA
jgi:hypothetical protein